MPEEEASTHKCQGNRTYYERKIATIDDMCDTDKGLISHVKKLEFYLKCNGNVLCRGMK